jgi:hypothetical protein
MNPGKFQIAFDPKFAIYRGLGENAGGVRKILPCQGSVPWMLAIFKYNSEVYPVKEASG